MSRLRTRGRGIDIDVEAPDEVLDAHQKPQPTVTVILPEPTMEGREAFAKYLAECIARKSVASVLGEGEPPEPPSPTGKRRSDRDH